MESGTSATCPAPEMIPKDPTEQGRGAAGAPQRLGVTAISPTNSTSSQPRSTVPSCKHRPAQKTVDNICPTIHPPALSRKSQRTKTTLQTSENSCDTLTAQGRASAVLRGSWPAPTPRPAHAKDTVETRRKEKHGDAVSTEGWDELFTLQPVALGAGYGTGERCLGITGRTAQPRSGRKSEEAAPQLPAGVRGPSRCPDTWPRSAHGGRHGMPTR